MNIVVSSPGSPGTSLTDNVKDQIVTIYDVLCEKADFDSAGDLRRYLEEYYSYKQAYSRNILAFLQNCGIVNYQNMTHFDNSTFFTNIGTAFVDVEKCIKALEREKNSPEYDYVLTKLRSIEEVIYFQCLVLMMKKKECNYAQDFYDVLCFVNRYGSIDSTEYLLIQYERAHQGKNCISSLSDTIYQYRRKELTIEIKTRTKNDTNGAAKSVNSFPYVSGNFLKAGVFYKDALGRFAFNKNRDKEIQNAIEEVGAIWQNSVQ